MANINPLRRPPLDRESGGGVLSVRLRLPQLQRGRSESIGPDKHIFLLDICKPLHYEDRISGELKCVVNVFGTVDGRVG